MPRSATAERTVALESALVSKSSFDLIEFETDLLVIRTKYGLRLGVVINPSSPSLCWNVLYIAYMASIAVADLLYVEPGPSLCVLA